MGSLLQVQTDRQLISKEDNIPATTGSNQKAETRREITASQY